MFVIKRNHILIVSLFILVLAAGIFNFADKRESNKVLDNAESVFLQSNLALEGELTSVSKDKNEKGVFEDDNTKEDDDSVGLATLVSSSEDDFFLEAKINRDETREERKEWLMDLINTSAQSDNAKEGAMNEICKLQELMEKEMQVESLIEAKGFGKTYVRIDDKEVDVIVSKKNLTQNDISQIVDIVERQTGFKASNIKISSLKASE